MRTFHFGIRVISVLVVAAILATLGTAVAGPPQGYSFVSFDEGLRQAQRQQKPALIYFGRVGCGWCEKTNVEAFGDAAVQKIYSANYVLVYVDSEGGERVTLPNGETLTEMELSARFKVYATPMFVFLEPGGREVAKVAGVQSASEFLAYDRYIRGEKYRTQTLPQFLLKPQ